MNHVLKSEFIKSKNSILSLEDATKIGIGINERKYTITREEKKDKV